MALPGRFERVGILLGSILLVGLPVSALVGTLYGLTIHPWLALAAWIRPGFVVGVPLAMERLPVTYHQVWVLTLSSWLLAFVGWEALGLSTPRSETSLVSGVRVPTVLLGILVAGERPVSIIGIRLGHA